jgi:2-polyprenyl-3-methyl-5-hydroxy-6-metoxy-1,4-benzoquinol methylase
VSVPLGEREQEDRAVDVSIAVERLQACPLCGSGAVRRWRTGYDRSHLISVRQFRYARCRDCGLRFLATRPDEADMHVFYPETYYDAPAPSREPSATERANGQPHPKGGWLARLNKRVDEALPDGLPSRLWNLYGPVRLGDTLLDYGCGSDAFLNWARARGWATIGADVSERVVAGVRASGHRGLLVQPSLWSEIEDGELTVVRMNHVVEHLYRPREVLRAILPKLRPGGVLHLATPNPASVFSPLLRSRWLGLDCPRHVMLYPPPTLARFCREVGFSRVDVAHEVLAKDLARSLGYVLHDLGRVPHSGILAMADRKRLASALHVPARLAAHVGASDRFHCFAVR